MNSRKLLVMSLLGTALIIGADRSFRGSFPRPRIFVALIFVYILLGFVVEFAPKLATYFGALLFIGVLLDRGPFVFNSISKRLNQGYNYARKEVK